MCVGGDDFYNVLAFLEQLRGDASLLDGNFPCLLTDPTLLDLETKRSWLHEKLSEKVDDDDFDASLNLEVHRGSVLAAAEEERNCA